MRKTNTEIAKEPWLGRVGADCHGDGFVPQNDLQRSTALTAVGQQGHAQYQCILRTVRGKIGNNSKSLECPLPYLCHTLLILPSGFAVLSRCAGPASPAWVLRSVGGATAGRADPVFSPPYPTVSIVRTTLPCY